MVASSFTRRATAPQCWLGGLDAWRLAGRGFESFRGFRVLGFKGSRFEFWA